jgi:hypothetical protein
MSQVAASAIMQYGSRLRAIHTEQKYTNLTTSLIR